MYDGGEGKRLVTRGVREDVGGLVGKMVGEVLTDNIITSHNNTIQQTVDIQWMELNKNL